MTTKVLALTDALGNLVRSVLPPGHRLDTVGVAPLISQLVRDGLICGALLGIFFISGLLVRSTRLPPTIA